MEFTWTPSRAVHRDGEFDYCTPSTKAGILMIRTLPDEVLLRVGRKQDWNDPVMILVSDLVGPNTNKNWTSGRCLEEAYDRGLLDETEFDYLNSRCS